MNHALVCKNYYKNKKNAVDAFGLEFIRFELYFNAVHARDSYYNAMKYHAIHVMKDLIPSITLKEIGNIVDLDHSTVIYYLKRYTPLDGHKEFISKNFERYIENQIYPLKPRSNKDLVEYGAFKPTSLAEAKYFSKSVTEKEERPEKKRAYAAPKKNPDEKY